MNSLDRYARQTMLQEIGEDGQRRFAAASVLVVGLGGLGAPVASYLTGAGIGRLGLCDPDTVSLTNLQRQILYTEADLGEPKTAVAARRLMSQNSSIKIDEYLDGLTEKNAERIVSYYDCVVDCTDNFPTRFLIERACAVMHRPWVHGAINEFGGIVTCFPENPSVRYSDLFGFSPDGEFKPKVLGVIGAVPGVVGSIEALETLKIIGRFGQPLFGEILSIDILTNEFTKFKI